MVRTTKCAACDRVEAECEIWIQCDWSRCKKWFHSVCIGFSDLDLTKINKFYCESCSTTNDILTTWLADRNPVGNEKTRNYFEVESIESHEIDEFGRRWFEVNWLGYRETTLEPERNLNGCLSLLQEYCRQHKLPLSKITGLIGGTQSDDESSFDNWVTISHVITTVNNLLEKSCPLRLEKLSKFRSSDKLVIFEHKNHSYVVLFQSKLGLGYIADGNNTFANNIVIRNQIRRRLKIDLTPIHFDQQFLEGYCGSSAALIALAMLNCYKSGVWPNKLVVNSRLRRRVVQQLHKANSRPVEHSRIQRIQASEVRCENCSKRFKGKQLKGYKNHIKFCSRKN